MSDILQKLGSAAKGAASKLKTLPPGESEAQGIKAISDQVNALKEPTTAATANETQRGEGTEPMPMPRYGSRPGEKRIDTSSYGDSAIKAPVYDRGGDVSMAAAKQAQSAGDAGIQNFVNAPDEQAPVARSAKPASDTGAGFGSLIKEGKDYMNQRAVNKVTTDRGDNVMQPAYMPKLGSAEPAMAAPVFDEGGEVAPDVNDGKHQVAIVKEGERVLTPEQNAQYKKEHPEVEERGAPADFGGRVLPNPTNVKPRWDTDPVTPKTYPGGAKMSVDNANVDEGSGDAEHFPTVTPKTTSANAPVLKPYSKVLEDKAAQKTAVQAPHSGIEPSTSNVEGQIPEDGPPAEEKTKKTYGTLLADHWLKTNGLPSTEGMKAPKEFNQGTPEPTLNKLGAPAGAPPQGGTPAAPAASAPAQGMKPMSPPNTSTERGGDLKARMAQLQKDHAQALAQRTPEGNVQADYIENQMNDLKKNNPWGSEGNHPGWAGKLGHIAAKVGNVAGDVLNPNIMAEIPGTDLNKRIQADQLQTKTRQDEAAEAADDKANRELAKNAAIPGYKQVTGGAIDPKDPEGKQQVAFYDEKDPTKIIYAGPVAPKEGASQDKKAFESVLSKIGTPDVADPTQQKSALKTAHDNKTISDQEYSNSLAYLGSTSNAPATQVTAANEKRTAGKTMYFDTPSGRKALTAAEATEQGFDPNQGVVENETQVAKDREKNSTYRVIEKSLTQFQKHVEEGKLTPKDVEVMGTITEDAEKPDYISKLIGGGFDDFLGHPITGYSEKLMKGTLTKNQYQDLSPAGRQLVADYYTTMMAHFANMKAAQGTIPRNPFIIQTEMHTIPKPFLSAEEAKPAFQNYLDQVAMRNADNVDFSGAKGTTKKEEPTTPTARPEGVPEGATHIYRDKQNNIVGYAQDGQYHPIEKK